MFQKFLDLLARSNNLGSSVEWLFYPAMLQDSPDKWWDDFKYRRALHEGIDICFFRTPQNPTMGFARKLRVPAMANGIVLNLCADFLGQTLVVEHEGFDPRPNRVVFVYSHLTPDPDLAPGSRVRKGQIMAKVFDTRIKRTKLLSHLHLSCIELPRSIPESRLNWDLFACREQVTLINPTFL